MDKTRVIVIMLAAILLGGSAWSIAADKGDANKPPMSMQGMEGMHMSGGMMDMMGTCGSMMQGGMMGHTWPQLPPGNEKLQFEMQAEMMQRMGEIAAKYAARINEQK